MIDKVQKIKEWIGKEQDGLMDAQGNFEYPEHEGAYHILCNLDTYIDSMQKEPKFKTGDRIKPIDSCLGSPRTIVDVCDSWYVTDQGTLDFEYEDNWELTEEHKKCMYSKGNYTNEDRKALCDGCEEECKYAQKEELVSVKNKLKALSDGKQHLGWIDDAMALEMGEELAKEVEDYIDVNGFDGLDSVEEVKSIACHFVNWQKAKDESTTEDLGEYINELSKQFPEVSFAKLSRIAVRVAKWQKQQMMEKAIDAQCFGFQGDALFSFKLPADKYLVGSEVKVIVIKED